MPSLHSAATTMLPPMQSFCSLEAGSLIGTWKDGTIQAGASAQSGHPIGVFMDYMTSDHEVVLAKVGISFVDAETAKKNLAEEIDRWDFDQVRKQTKDNWNEILKRIDVEGGTEAERVNFYTSFYRGMGFENFLSWPNGGALHFIVRPEVAAERLAQYILGTFCGGFLGFFF